MSELSPVDAFDQASLEAFTSQLVGAGFEPDPGTLRRFWTGPAHSALAPLTDARTMRIVIRDGWPVVFPFLFAEGLHTNHLTADGYVCLWHEGDGSREWVNLDGFFDRIASWCHDAEHGWDPSGLARDAQLNFARKHAAVATFDLAEFQFGGVGAWGDFHGVFHHGLHVSLQAGRRPSPKNLAGLWFRTGLLDVPPRHLAELQQALTRSQARGLDRALEARRLGPVLEPSGSVDLILLSWDRDSIPYVLVLALEGTGVEISALALQPGPTDEKSLLLRAGPDAALLRNTTVAMIGVGALGGHVALTLAESGVGRLHLVDGDQILPENAVRHVAGHNSVGGPKPHAVAAAVQNHAPWTEIGALTENPLTPASVGRAIADADVIVDTTGGDAATQAVCLAAAAHAKAVVSGALYRGGAIARVRRQGTPQDVPILDRTPALGYERIPPDDVDELIQPAVGCSGPVHNAPPTAVLACAALIADASIDVLTRRFALPDELIDVYRALPGEPPFDRVGRVSSRSGRA